MVAERTEIPLDARLVAEDGDKLRLYAMPGQNRTSPKARGLLQDLRTGKILEVPLQAAMNSGKLTAVGEKPAVERAGETRKFGFFDKVIVNGKPVRHMPLPAPGTKPTVDPRRLRK